MALHFPVSAMRTFTTTARLLASRSHQYQGPLLLTSGLHSNPLDGFDLSITVGPNNIVRSPYPDVSVPNASLYSHVFRDFDKFGRKIALVNGETGREFSFNEIKEKTNRLSAALNRNGIEKGDVVALVAPNCPEYAIFFFGCLASEATVTTCNPAYTADELAYQFKNSDAKIVATVPECLDTVRKAAEMNGISDIIVIDGSQQSEAGLISYQSLIEDSGSAFRTPQVDVINDVAVLPYSSGTTGLGKGVMLTHKGIVTNLCQLHHPQIVDLTIEGTTLIAVIPFFHIYGMIVIMCSSLHHGSKVVTLPRFEPEMFLNALQSNRVTIANLVPPLIVFLAKSPAVDKYDLSSINSIMSGAAPLGGDILTTAKERIGCGVIRQGYGLTETGTVTHLMPLHFKMTKPHSVGTPIRNTEVKIADIETGESLPVGKEGEVCIRGGNVMKGYLNMPEATRSCITDEGWFHTGDIGYYDSEGCFYITDRLKELIKVKGFQVAPAELEAILLTHPNIADAAVVGTPHERLGEAPKAFVVRKEGGLAEEEVRQFVAGRVADFKQLAGGVQFIEAVPKSASGKILRRLLKNNAK